MKTMVYYYSRKGNNIFLAKRIANDLKCEIDEIEPGLNNLAFIKATPAFQLILSRIGWCYRYMSIRPKYHGSTPAVILSALTVMTGSYVKYSISKNMSSPKIIIF